MDIVPTNVSPQIEQRAALLFVTLTRSSALTGTS